ncbi:hypothetical protein ACFX1Z_022495 [Malus domestica]
MGIVEEAHNVRVVGSGQQVLVLAHGFGTDQSVWKHLVHDNRVIMYDNMGAGTTNPEYFDFERYPTHEGYTYDLLAILKELHIESCIFVGHSTSVMVCTTAAVTRPDLFTKLIMIAASPSSVLSSLKQCNLLRALQSEIQCELSSNPFQKRGSSSLGDFVVEWDSPRS